MRNSLSSKSLLSLFLLAGILSISSCGKDLNKRLPRKDGSWSVTSEHKLSYENEELIQDTTLSDLGRMDFNKNGSGIRYFTSDTADFSWAYNPETKQISLIEDGFTFNFDVIENKSNSQTWSNTIEISAQGVTSKLETTRTLERL